jgi:PAS domain S-box-containing protein
MEGGDSTRTMRIDIHPDFLGETLARKKQKAQAADKAKDTSFVVLETASRGRSADYRKLLESVYDAVLVTDEKGRIFDVNSRALDFFLCGREGLSGANVLDLISGSAPDLLEAIRRNLKAHRYTLIEAHCLRRDQSTFPAEIAVNRVDLDDEGHLCFFVRDISVRKRAQDALEDAIRRLEEHDRARSEFVSSVSHELRTPLTSMIYAIANLLRGVAGPLTDGVRRYIELLNGDSKRLLGTVNDILDLRKIEMKSLRLVKTRVPFEALVRRGAESLRVQADGKSLRLDVVSEPPARFVDCDTHKVERVVLNIVGNSVKFTEEGGAIEVRVEDDGARPGYVMMSVRDTGIGIPPEAINRVTEMYFTVGEQASGSGLGLAISKQIVELHGGRIEIESPPCGYDKGTVVRVSLPVVTPPKVLVVDDQPDVTDVVAGQVRGWGYEVRTCSDGAEALQVIGREKPAAVVLDLVLTGLSGTELILKLKADKETARIPIVVLTGAELGGDKARVMESFSIPALGKPWRESELRESLEGAFLGTARLGG